MQLNEMTCKACSGAVPILTEEEMAPLLIQVPLWQLVDFHHLSRTIKFADFVTALAAVNRIGALAESQGHHPDLLLRWGEVQITIFTHKVNGVTEADFVLAALIDQLP